MRLWVLGWIAASLVLNAGSVSDAVAAEPAGQGGHAHHHAAADAESGGGDASADALVIATSALDRFQDIEVAEEAGYVKPGRNDGFLMGEHWYHPALLAAGRCELERPAFLQYLVIDGRRTLIGTGYVCDADDPDPTWFGGASVWHSHGPELCRFRKGAFMDASYFARALPNAVSDETWQELCSSWWGTPEERPVKMLHTWNWIAHPDGATAHQNRAIPFLRAGLRVPSREELDSGTGRDALAVLALAQGDTRKRYEGAFLVLDWGFFDKWGPRRAIRAHEKRAEEAVDQMRDAERLGDRVLYAAAARRGAALQGSLHRELALRFDLEEQAVMERWMASLVVHDHTAH